MGETTLFYIILFIGILCHINMSSKCTCTCTCVRNLEKNRLYYIQNLGIARMMRHFNLFEARYLKNVTQRWEIWNFGKWIFMSIAMHTVNFTFSYRCNEKIFNTYNIYWFAWFLEIYFSPFNPMSKTGYKPAIGQQIFADLDRFLGRHDIYHFHIRGLPGYIMEVKH